MSVSRIWELSGGLEASPPTSAPDGDIAVGHDARSPLDPSLGADASASPSADSPLSCEGSCFLRNSLSRMNDFRALSTS